VLGVVGAGAQARIVVRALAGLRSVEAVWVHDVEASSASALVDLARKLGAAGHVAGSAAEVARRAEILILATRSRAPLLSLADLRRRPAARAHSRRDRERQPRARAHRRRRREVLRGDHPGRVGADALTIYAPVGLPWQDLALAWPLYQAVEQQAGGAVIDLLE